MKLILKDMKIDALDTDEKLHLVRRCGEVIARAGTPESFSTREGLIKFAQRAIDILNQIDPQEMR